MPFADPAARKAYWRKYYAANRSRVIAQVNAWRVANKDKRIAWQRMYRELNADKVRAYMARYYRANKKRLTAQNAVRNKKYRASGAAAKWSRDFRAKLPDVYVRWLIVKGSGMPCAIVPEKMVEAKRELLKLKREIFKCRKS